MTDTTNSGRISVYHANRGFGFIHEIGSEGRLLKYFFHINSVVAGDPQGGRKVRFNVVANPKGPVATNIEVVSPGIDALVKAGV